MKPGKDLHRRVGAMSIAGLLAALVLLPAGATAAGRPGVDLSPRLAELAKPSLRSAPPASQAARLGVAPEGPGSLLRDGSRVLVDVRFERGAAAGVGDLRAAGAEIVHVSRRYQTVTVAARPADLPALAALPRVGGVREVREPLTFAAPVCFGAATSEGDLQLGAMAARDGFEVDGSGVTVGILSDSFDRDAGSPTRAEDDVASGDLPGVANPCGQTAPVGLLDDTLEPAEATDEGRAMAQIVHDLAPGASLAFASAFNGELSFAANIAALADAGAEVIVDDVVYLEEPFFQDGPIAVAVREATEAGVAYFSSAGNNNLIDALGRNIASWEAPVFRDTPCPASLVDLDADVCMDFDPGAGADPTLELTVSKGATLTVGTQWGEPWNGVTADIDVFLLDDEDEPVQEGAFFIASIEDNVGVSQRPVEVLQWENDGGARKVRLAVNRCFGEDCNPGADPGAMPRLKIALLQNGSGVTASEYPQSSGGDVVGPTIFGHNGAAGAVSVGAIRYNATSAPEPFSSRGPVTHHFGPVEGATPAPQLGSPEVLAKPDLVATDGGVSTFFASCVANVWRFFGTSAAAPHAAAVAALQLQAEPAATASAVKQAQIDSADPVGLFGPSAVGAGVVDAPEAIELLAGPFPGGTAFAQLTPQNCGLDPEPEDPETPSPDPEPTPLATAVEDRTAPRTFFRKRPRRVVRTRWSRATVTFRFGSDEAGVTYLCRIDGGLRRVCPERLTRRFRVGPHVLRVMARDAAGNVDRTPALFRFTVKRRL